MRALLLIPIVLALPACKKKPDEAGMLVVKMREFRNMMCACKDKACADKVQADMNTWSSANVKNSRTGPAPNEEQMKELQAIGTQYGECIAKAMTAADAAQPPVAALTPPTPSPAPTLTNADQIVKRTFDDAGSTYIVDELTLSYVRSDGTVDPTYGKVAAQFGKPKPPDPASDPARPIGAPVIAPVARYEDPDAHCPTYEWKNGKRTEGEHLCFSVGAALARPRCSVAEVWKRAIEAGAPATGLAVLTLHAETRYAQQRWDLAIRDAPRKIDFSHTVVDTCDPVLEKP